MDFLCLIRYSRPLVLISELPHGPLLQPRSNSILDLTTTTLTSSRPSPPSQLQACAPDLQQQRGLRPPTARGWFPFHVNAVLESLSARLLPCTSCSGLATSGNDSPCDDKVEEPLSLSETRPTQVLTGQSQECPWNASGRQPRRSHQSAVGSIW